MLRRRLSAEGAKPESHNRWKSELGHVQYSTKVFGALEPFSRFLAISPKQMQLSRSNFQHPLSHQYHTLCENLKIQGIIGRPQMTSEWHNVPSISTPPRTQFLSYDQLTYMTCLRISRVIKLLSRIFKILKNFKIQKLRFFFLLKISPSKSNFPQNRNTSWMAMANEYVHKISSRWVGMVFGIISRTKARSATKRGTKM